MSPSIVGKSLHVGDQRFLVKGVSYGTFAPGPQGHQFPSVTRVAQDFQMMRAHGFNAVRTYTPPPIDLLDEAARHDLKVMVGLPWAQHVAFLDDPRINREVRREQARQVRALRGHPAVLLVALGNEIPPEVVRWHGAARTERFLGDLYESAKAIAPETLFTYVNYPPTEYLDVPFFDVCSFNVYLHREQDLRAYLAHLQHIAGPRPLLLTEVGADSIRETPAGQASITAMHLRSAFAEGACGAVVFSWTDEWWRGGNQVTDWGFGLVDAARRPKPALHAVSRALREVPFSEETRRGWPKVSVIVCAYNAADTLDDCLSSLERLNYPDFEVLVVDDGSRDATAAIAGRYPSVRLIEAPHGGLSAARNAGLAAAAGEIVAYTDADVRVDPDWLAFLVQPLLTSDVVGAGGPNIVPADDSIMAQCIARSPGGPTHVLLDARIAEHVPGCNMAFRRDALHALGGFNPVYLRAGDDVDVCWRFQMRGQRIGFSAAALVWHHHRPSVRAYWRQQVGYGEAETWLLAHHPEKFPDGRMRWQGRIYSPLPFIRSMSGRQIHSGVWGTAAFPSVYRTDSPAALVLPHLARWQVVSFALIVCGLLLGGYPVAGLLVAAGAIGLGVTASKCLRFALCTDIRNLQAIPKCPAGVSRAAIRLVIAGLHAIQPLARAWGRMRGALFPPQTAPKPRVRAWGGGRFALPSVREVSHGLSLLAGRMLRAEYWSERWIGRADLLRALAVRFQRTAAGGVEVDDGWHGDWDLRLSIGRWAFLLVRGLVEDHGAGKCLLRMSARVTATPLAIATSTLLLAGSVGAFWVPISYVQAVAWLLPAVMLTTIVRRTAIRVREAKQAIEAVAREAGMVTIRSTARPAVARLPVKIASSLPAALVKPAVTSLRTQSRRPPL